MNILIIDNYDSFVYNIARYFVQLNCNTLVVKHDEIKVSDIDASKISHIVISPGPCSPLEAGISLEVVKKFYRQIPILGICLGHQVIGHAFGAEIKRALRPMHGCGSNISHNGAGVFFQMQQPMYVGRYHSLIVVEDKLSNECVVTARSQENEIMALAHRNYPVVGVQFHPESILTNQGLKLFNNFLSLVPSYVETFEKITTIKMEFSHDK